MAPLEITPCSRETGRQRYRLSQRARLPFETRELPPAPAPVAAVNTAAGGDSDTETFLALEELFPDVTSDPEVEGQGDGDEEDAAINAAADDHEDPHEESDEASAEDSHEDSSEESDEDPSEVSDRAGFPAALQWRLNLTALSQRYNLYFAAYHNSIHVSRPRSCVTHSLPAVPDLVLTPAASRAGLDTIGAMDVNDAHQVNHMIIGLLGEAEILLMAYDDGDVIGYYTKQIEDTVGDSYSPVKSHDLVPFFHENVGCSAWGLAIHQKSRLIAVGSNSHTAIVFVPALNLESANPSPKSPGTENPGSERCMPPLGPGSMFYITMKDQMGRLFGFGLGEGIGEDERVNDPKTWISLRTFNKRIEMTTGDAGHNIPNLTFSSDEEGLATHVLAVDVRGSLWVMDLTSEGPHIRIPGIHTQRNHRGAIGEPASPLGWGVLTIPESSFLPTKNFRDTLGLPEAEARFLKWRGDRWIDISRGIQHVPNNSTVHRWSRRPNTAFQGEHGQLVEMRPWFGTDELLDSPREEWGPVEPGEDAWYFRDDSSILRTYGTDFELMPFEKGGSGIMYEYPMMQTRRPHHGPARHAMERLGTVLLVPELSLVVGASMTGRVALVSLTRHEPADTTLGLKRGLKIEAILPTEQDENKNLRPLCPLYGVAVGPIPQTPAAKKTDPNRFRLMIHYYDLSILSYEISRHRGTDELSVWAV